MNDPKILDKAAERIAQPLDKAASAIVKVADRVDKTLYAAETALTYGPYMTGGVVGLLCGLLLARMLRK